MKWLIMLMMVVLPVIASAEDEAAPAPDPGAPAVESQIDPGTQDPARDGDPARPAEAVEKAPAKQGDKDGNSGVRFQSIDDLNKVGR
jgi:hypothetical protein